MKLNMQKYQHLLENLPDAFAYHQIVIDEWGIPVDYIFLEVNTAFETMTGLKRENVIGRKVTRVLPGIEKSEFDWISVYGQVALTGKPTRFKCFLEQLGRWYNVRAYSDEPGCFAAIFHDMAEEKKTWHALLGSEENYRDLVKNASDMIQCVVNNGKFAFVNEAWLSTLGYSMEELNNLTLWDVIHPDSLDHYMAVFQEVLDGKAPGNIEVIFVTKNGNPITVEGNVNVRLDEEGRFLNTREMFRNITERKQVENTLRESEARKSAILNAIPDMMFLFDKREAFVNHKSNDQNALLLKPETFLDKRVVKVLLPELAQLTQKHLKLVFETGKMHRYEYRLDMDKELKTFESRLVPCGEDKALAVVRDITEQKQAEDELRQSEQRAIRQRVAISELFFDNIDAEGDISSTLKKFTKAISDAIVVERSSIWILDENGDQLECLSLYEAKPGRHSSGDVLQVKDLHRYFAAILKESRIYAENAQQDPRTRDLTEGYLKPLGITSMLDAGIIIDGKLKGVVCIEHIGAHRKWHADEEAFASTVASMVAQLFIAADREQLMETLHLSEEQHRTLTENIPIGIYRSTPGPEGQFLIANNTFLNLFGIKSKDELTRVKEADLYQDRSERSEFSKNLLAQGSMKGVELALKHRDGSPIWGLVTAAVVYDDQGNAAYFDCTMEDVTERKQAEKALEDSEESSRALIEAIPDLLFRCSREGVYLDVVVKDESMLPFRVRSLYRQNALLGKRINEVLPEDMAENFMAGIEKALAKGTVQVLEYSYQVNDSTHYFEARLAPIGTAEVVTIVRDITERKTHETELKYMSFHDQLTGLYNRHYLEKEMKRLDEEGQLPTSIIMADLNGLKMINDTFGYNTGDQMLKKTASILKEAIREDDIIARFGADEFLICLPLTPEKGALALSNRIAQAFSKEQIKDVPVSISVGIAVKKRTEQNMSEVIREAEDDMNRVKLTESRSGKNTVLTALRKTLAEKSFETETHTRNMENIALKIGEKIGLPDSELHRLSLLINLHDIGKINIPEEMLFKKSALTEEEWEIMEKHSETGYRIARAAEEFAHVAEDILAHHEHWDGSGYPQGLKGEAIPLLARIAAVADAYETMKNGRPYKKAMTPEAIASEFKRCAGTQFDPRLVEIFFELDEKTIENIL